MRTNEGRPHSGTSTFTQLKRRDQLVQAAIDAIAEIGFPRTSVAEVARRAGVSKGVVSYHFAAKDDLIDAVIADILASMREYLEPRLLAANPMEFPERFIAPYITTWVEYYRARTRECLALIRIHNAFRDETGRPNPAFDVREEEIATIARILENGQARGGLRAFDARTMATVMKAALNDLWTQYAEDPGLDLEAYGAELIAIFESATRPGADPGPPPGSI
jgi:TetR/AcrR family transcriptional regulator, fatty acid metabolism regulator protein